MGWTSSGDMRQQVRLRFDTVEEAIAYCERHGIAYQVFRAQAAGAPRHVLRRQFRLQAAAIPGRIEARVVRSAGWRSGVPSPLLIGRDRSLVRDSAAVTPRWRRCRTPRSTRSSGKNSASPCVLQKPPRKPARMSPGNVAANQNPIIMRQHPDGSASSRSVPVRPAPGGARRWWRCGEIADQPQRARLAGGGRCRGRHDQVGERDAEAAERHLADRRRFGAASALPRPQPHDQRREA